MAGYEDTRQLIIDTLMGRPAGTEIQPEDHQRFALALTDYIRSVELNSGNAFIGFAQTDTVPIQSDNGQCFYISTVEPGQTVNFVNFIDSNGNVISVSSPEGKMSFVTLIWNTQYWSYQSTVIDTNWVIKQTTGDNEAAVMSQKAVTDALGILAEHKENIGNKVQDIDSVPTAQVESNYPSVKAVKDYVDEHSTAIPSLHYYLDIGGEEGSYYMVATEEYQDQNIQVLEALKREALNTHDAVSVLICFGTHEEGALNKRMLATFSYKTGNNYWKIHLGNTADYQNYDFDWDSDNMEQEGSPINISYQGSIGKVMDSKLENLDNAGVGKIKEIAGGQLVRPKVNLTSLFEEEAVEGEEAFRKVLMIGPDIDIKTYLKELVKRGAVEGVTDGETDSSYSMVLSMQSITDGEASIYYQLTIEGAIMILFLSCDFVNSYQVGLSTIMYEMTHNRQNVITYSESDYPSSKGVMDYVNGNTATSLPTTPADNTIYNLGKVANIVVASLPTSTRLGIVINFTSGETATQLSYPANSKWNQSAEPTIETNKSYQITILDGVWAIAEISTLTQA